MKKSQTAVMYARVSSKDQEREGFSIPAQQKLLREYARQHTLTVLKEFVDVETAKQAGRGQFGEMISFLKANPTCRTILVEKTDRLYRNIKDWTTVDDLCAMIHFVKEGVIVSPDSRSSDKFMHGIKVLMAKNYVDNLSEEVKKGMREKAEQGFWPSVAPIGYVNNLSTHRIEIDPVRGELIARLFELYATETHSLKALTAKAKEMGLTHPNSGRPIMKAQVHRVLQNPIYYGEFVWLEQRYQGSHEALITKARFDQVQAVLHRKPRATYPKQKHAFMGLLKCARCGCSMTAEKKKGKYIYYRCTAFHGACGNTYIREERLAELLGGVIKPIQITTEVAEGIAKSLRATDQETAKRRASDLRQLDQRRSAAAMKLDRGYDDFVSGKISEEFWSRKSKEWEAELQTVEAAQGRLQQPQTSTTATAEKTLELAKQAENLYKSQDPLEQRRLLETVLSNCTFDSGTLCPTYSKPFDLLVRGNETGEWRGRRDSNPRPPA
jgi:site-specific DNA recombinase